MQLRSLTQLPTRVRDRLRDRFGLVDTVWTVHERVGAVGGGPLASSMAMAGFLSLFPLLLVGIAVVGVLSVGDVSFAQDLVDEMGLEGEAADTVLDAVHVAERSRRTATIVGVVGLVWAGLGVVAAVEGTLGAMWQVKARGLAGKLHQLAWLAGAGALLLIAFAAGPLLAFLPGPAGVATLVLSLGVDVLLFLWTFSRLTNAPVGWRDHLPGAVVGGVGLVALQLVGSLLVPQLVASSSALYGSIGVVFALLTWLMLAARLFVYAAAYNVVRYERNHGTVTIDLTVPRLEGQVPLEATRGGAIADSTPKDLSR